MSLSRGIIDEFNIFPRMLLAQWYLRGEGLEIGAQSSPLRLPSRAKAKYVDVISREEIIRQFPNLNPKKVVQVDIISDGFTLGGIGDNQFDFVIANHVLEHSANPIGTLSNWTRVLKPGGVLFCSVPLKNRSFDKGRNLTAWDHMADDFRAYSEKDEKRVEKINLQHYEEWLDHSEPEILKRPPISGLERERRIEKMLSEKEEIHFHTFDRKSFRELLTNVSRIIGIPLEVVSVFQSRIEVISIAKKVRESYS